MKRYFIKLSYNGSDFHGWQVQPNADTIQANIEKCLSKMYSRKIEIVGCGRTDTGVHAKKYFAHFEVDELGFEYDKLCYKLNSMLPFSIAIQSVEEVNKELHARFSAIAREYRYSINFNKSPFKNKRSWWVSKKLDVKKMKEALFLLSKYDDFTSFAKLHAGTKSNICEIQKVEIIEKDSSIDIVIGANRFLRNMVRAIVGTLVDVGLSKISLDEFEEVIKSKNRGRAGVSAPPEGLYLYNVQYPKGEIINE